MLYSSTEVQMDSPEGTPVRVHGPGLPLNAKSRGLAGRSGRPGYDVSIEGVFSAVIGATVLRWRLRPDREVIVTPTGVGVTARW